MKNLFFAVVFLIQPLIVFSQTQADYEHAMGRFMKFYNSSQADSINAMFSDQWGDLKKDGTLWESGDDDIKNYGKLQSFKYLGIDTKDANPGLAVFISVFSKAGEKTTSLTLDKENHLGTFRLITSSEGIDELLKNQKK